MQGFVYRIPMSDTAKLALIPVPLAMYASTPCTGLQKSKHSIPYFMLSSPTNDSTDRLWPGKVTRFCLIRAWRSWALVT